MATHEFSSSLNWVKNYEKFISYTKFPYVDTSGIENCVNLTDLEPLKKGLRQFHYWLKKLQTTSADNTLYIALLGPNGLVRPNVLELSLELKKVCDMQKLTAVQLTANVNIVGFSFNDKEQKEKIIKELKFFHEYLVLFIGVSLVNSTLYKILWLPPLFEDEDVHTLLNKYSISHSLSHEVIQTDINKFTPTNVVKGILTLKPGLSFDSIPHLINLPLPYKGCALIILENREPFCLKCRLTGHVRRVCPNNHCLRCFSFHPTGGRCSSKTFSSVTAGKIISRPSDDWLADDELMDSPESLGEVFSNYNVLEKDHVESSREVSTDIISVGENVQKHVDFLPKDDSSTPLLTDELITNLDGSYDSESDNVKDDNKFPSDKDNPGGKGSQGLSWAEEMPLVSEENTKFAMSTKSIKATFGQKRPVPENSQGVGNKVTRKSSKFHTKKTIN